MLDPRYWPGLEKERPAETEEGAEDAVVVAEEASLSPPLGTAALTPLIALPDGGVGDIDVDAMAAAAAPVGGGNPAQAPIMETLNNDAPAAPTIEPDPTDDSNIIIECVAFAGTPVANAPAQVRVASMPQHPLGPTKCSPPDLRYVQ